LRREEVAQLADVGASWYTWLEQGRDIQVSEALLERLAQALRLNPTERSHLFELAQGRPPPRAAALPTSVSPTLRRVLDAHPFPGAVTTLRWDVVAWNEASVRLFGELVPHNALWSTFTDPALRASRPNWEAEARTLVARFRLEAGRAANRSEFDVLADQLAEVSSEFRRLWSAHELLDSAEGAKAVSHPDVGVIELDHVTLVHVEPDGRALRVILYAPQPGLSAERAAKLFGAR
jgi:transcriptional regulator with XRE-family HTH domain